MTTTQVEVLFQSKQEMQQQPAGNSRYEIIQFMEGDPENPYNWKFPKKLFVALTTVLLTVNSTNSSAITSNAVTSIMEDFHVEGDMQGFLPVSVYLVGYIFGPLVFSPLSESIGRKGILFWTFNVFLLFTLASGLSKNWPSLLIFRLICGTCASVPLTVIGGVYADVFAEPRARGRALIGFMSGTTFGPLLGPIISGFVTTWGWRWVFWVSLIIGGCSWVPLAFMPETFAPILLRRKAEKIRKSTGRTDIFAPVEVEYKNRDRTRFILVSLTRPLSMLCFEPLVYLNCLYIALLYALFYMFFEAYPIIFEGIYGFTNGQSALALSPLGIGAALTAPVLIYYDAFYESSRSRGANWARNEEMHRMPIACLGGPFCVASLFWLGWTARPEIRWIVPCLSGLSFGFGYLLIFTALTNYMVDAYDIYAASAMAASCFSRSIVGATLPLASKPLYGNLGISWATSLLGFLSLGMVCIPFSLMYFGPRIRRRSKLCQELLKRSGESSCSDGV